MDKRENSWVEIIQFNKATKEILLILLIIVMIIIMSMQNKLYGIQFFSPPIAQSTASPWAENTDPSDFCKFHGIPPKGQTPRKIQTPGKPKSQWLSPPSQPHS